MADRDEKTLSELYKKFIESPGAENSKPIQSLINHFRKFIEAEMLSYKS